MYKQVNKACGLPYDEGMIVYTCADCQIDEYCSICAECFRNGNHEGHSWRAVKITSQEGCCDCGNPDAWAEKGYCKNHKGEDAIEFRDGPLNDDDINKKFDFSIDRDLLIQLGIICKEILNVVVLSLRNENAYHFIMQNLITPGTDTAKAQALSIEVDGGFDLDHVVEHLQEIYTKMEIALDSKEDYITLSNRTGEIPNSIIYADSEGRFDFIKGNLLMNKYEAVTFKDVKLITDTFVTHFFNYISELCFHDEFVYVIARLFYSERIYMKNITQGHSYLLLLIYNVRILTHNVHNALNILLYRLIHDKAFKIHFSKQYVDLFKKNIIDILEQRLTYSDCPMNFSIQILTHASLMVQLCKELSIHRVILHGLWTAVHTPVSNDINMRPVVENEVYNHNHPSFHHIYEILTSLNYLFAKESVMEILLNDSRAWMYWLEILALEHGLEPMKRKTVMEDYETGLVWSMPIADVHTTTILALLHCMAHKDRSEKENLLKMVHQVAVRLMENDHFQFDEQPLEYYHHGDAIRPYKMDTSQEPVSFIYSVLRLYCVLLIDYMNGQENTYRGVHTLEGNKLEMDGFTYIVEGDVGPFIDQLNATKRNDPNFLQSWFNECTGHMDGTLDRVPWTLKWIEYPMRIFIAMAELASNMWRYNNDILMLFTANYKRYLRVSLFERDLEMLNMGMLWLGPDLFLMNTLRRFGIESWYHPMTHQEGETDSSTVSPAIPTLDRLEKLTEADNDLLIRAEVWMEMILSMMKSRPVFSHFVKKDFAERELIQILAVGPMPHSKILKEISFNSIVQEDQVDNILMQLCQPARTLDQKGVFELKPEYFDQVDVFWPYYRTEQRNQVIGNYFQWLSNHIKSNNDTYDTYAYTPATRLSTLMPQYGVLNYILEETILHRAIFNDLYRYVYLYDRHKLFTKVFQSLHLIELAVTKDSNAHIPDSFLSMTVEMGPKGETIMMVLYAMLQVEEYQELRPLIRFILTQVEERNQGGALCKIGAVLKSTRIKQEETPIEVESSGAIEERKKRMEEIRQRHLQNAKRLLEGGVNDEEDNEESHCCVMCLEPLDTSLEEWGYIGFVYPSYLGELTQTTALQRATMERSFNGYEGEEETLFTRSCGHHIHFKCYDDYYTSLINSNTYHSTLIEYGEFACPLCKTVSNIVIPATPFTTQWKLSEIPLKEAFQTYLEHSVSSDTEESMELDVGSPENKTWTRKAYSSEDPEFEVFNNMILKDKDPCQRYSSLSKNFYMSVERFIYRVELVCVNGYVEQIEEMSEEDIYCKCNVALYSMLECLEIEYREVTEHRSLASHLHNLPNDKKFGVKIIFDLLAAYTTILRPVDLFEEYLSPCLETSEISCLTFDPLQFLISTLLLQCYTTKNPVLDQTVFLSTLSVVVRMELLRSIIALRSNIQKDEAYLYTESRASEEAMGVLMMCEEWFSEIDHRDMDHPLEKDELLLVFHYCLPMIRRIAILYSVLFNTSIPETSHLPTSYDEIGALFEFMGYRGLEDFWGVLKNTNSNMMKTWIQGFAIKEGNSHLPTLPYRFELYPLPKQFMELMNQYMDWRCDKCLEQHVCLDLVTGKIYCTCMIKKSTLPNNVGVYVLIRRNKIFGVRGDYVYTLPPLYFDQYGEPDYDLQRGNPLFLDEEEYEKLRKHYIRHDIGIKFGNIS